MDSVTFETIKAETFFAEPNVRELIDRYATESSIDDLPTYKPNTELYRLLEANGVLHTIVARKRGQMIGFVVVLITPNAHYSQLMAVTESFFVHPDHRKGGVGLNLLDEAQVLAKQKGATCIFLSAPVQSRLDRVMQRKDWKHTNQVYFRRL